MTNTEMIERVATSIAFAMGWDHATPQSRHYARFAVRAMREPTKEMKMAVNDAALKKVGLTSGWMCTSVDAWQAGHTAAIDAILKEHP